MNIFEAIKRNDIEAIKKIHKNSDILKSIGNKNGLFSYYGWMTPLLYASIAGRTKIIELLFDKGCDIHEYYKGHCYWYYGLH